MVATGRPRDNRRRQWRPGRGNSGAGRRRSARRLKLEPAGPCHDAGIFERAADIPKATRQIIRTALKRLPQVFQTGRFGPRFVEQGSNIGDRHFKPSKVNDEANDLALTGREKPFSLT